MKSTSCPCIEEMMFILLLSTFIAVAHSQEPSTCCTKGYLKGASVLTDDINCNAPPSIADVFSSKSLRLMCVGFYEQCCRSTANTLFCRMGEKLAMANQLCTRSSRVGGESKLTCCDCCKRGARLAREGVSCNQTQEDRLCTEAFKSCCLTVKKTTDLKNSRKYCSDIKCDSKSTSSCVETEKGPRCLCKQGYAITNNGLSCTDIDECQKKNSCPGTVCTNIPGSYKCGCEDGFMVVNRKCVKKNKNCKKGYEVKNGECVDVDECLSGKHRCSTGSFCMNTDGDYACFRRCQYPRFQVIKAGVCTDVDECKLGLDDCGRNYECKNTVGLFKCNLVRCNEGYRLVDGYCEDIDECQNKSICGEAQQGSCRNADGTYYCDCQSGYAVNSITKKCADIDECKINHGYCIYQCTNSEGSYRCTCPAGYEARGRFCSDINECSRNPCPSSDFCFNTFGSYACINQSCPNKYFVKTSRKYDDPASCLKKDCKWQAECGKIKLKSVKRTAYKFYKNVAHSAFIFRYWMSFDRRYYRVSSRFVKGNEEGYFYIQNMAKNELRIINQKKITGPKKFHLEMHVDINSKLGDTMWKYVYHFYVYVSAYDFA